MNIDGDRLFTPAEFLALKLTGDWVVPSCCSTATRGDAGTEAISGLSHAVLYADAPEAVGLGGLTPKVYADQIDRTRKFA